MKPGLLDRVSISPEEYLVMAGKEGLPDQSQITVLTAPTSNLLFYRDPKSGFSLPIANEGVVSYSGAVGTLKNLVRVAIKLDGGEEGQLEDVLTTLSNNGGDLPWSDGKVILRLNDVYQSKIWTRNKPTGVNYVPHPSFDDLEYRIEVEKAYDRLNWDSSFNQPFTSFPEVPDESNGPRKVRKALTKKQEVELFLMYNYFKYRLDGILENIKPDYYSKKSYEANKFYDKVQRVEAWIADYNLALVMAMARRTRIPYVDYQELISEGNMALLRAIDKFDVSRGFKFSTYACRAILKGFSRMATKTGRYAIRWGTSHDPDKECSDYDVMKHQIQQNEVVDNLREVLAVNTSNLTDVEQRVITERFALGSVDGKKKTLSVVGLGLGLTTERVRQIQKKALEKLKRGMGELPGRESISHTTPLGNQSKLYRRMLREWEFHT
jgi:RNA polymerase sigma factor (sigma-70 family)